MARWDTAMVCRDGTLTYCVPQARCVRRSTRRGPRSTRRREPARRRCSGAVTFSTEDRIRSRERRKPSTDTTLGRMIALRGPYVEDYRELPSRPVANGANPVPMQATSRPNWMKALTLTFVRGRVSPQALVGAVPRRAHARRFLCERALWATHLCLPRQEARHRAHGQRPRRCRLDATDRDDRRRLARWLRPAMNRATGTRV